MILFEITRELRTLFESQLFEDLLQFSSLEEQMTGCNGPLFIEPILWGAAHLLIEIAFELTN